MDRKTMLNWLVFAILTVFSITVVYPPNQKIRLGLDLQGGSSFTLQIDEAALRDQLRDKLSNERKCTPAEISDADVDTAVKNTLRDADTRVLEVLRNRVDTLGVNEPVIAAGQNHRILIQLPGADASQQAEAEARIRSAAVLQFRLLHKQNSELTKALFANNKNPEGYHAVQREHESLFERDEKKYKDLMQDPTYPRRLGIFEVPDVTYEFMLERVADREGGPNHFLYRPCFVRRRVEMTGDTLAHASDERDTMAGEVGVSLTFKKAGARQFEEITGKYVERQLAIVLDNTLYSAPVIREKISGGQARISGSFSIEEARRLRDVLNAGSLPVPVTIIEKHIVGSTLGADAIHSGVNSAIIGCILVCLFMLVYYMYCGLVANIALLMDIVLLPVGMLLTAGFMRVFISEGGSGGLLQLPVLTMPGIAGIVLTIGMAVDANVLIFERMREEFLAGKSVRAAVSAGYERAFSAIFDSNVSAIITAVIMFIFGSGPVRGYAITLCAGIIVSMYTALVLTRLIFEATMKDTTKPYKMMRWIKETAIDFMAPRKVVFIFSTAVIVITMAIFYFNIKSDPKRDLSVEFTGGTTLTYKYDKKADIAAVDKATKAAGVTDALPQYQTAMDGSGGVLVVKTSHDKIGDLSVGDAIEKQLKSDVPAGGFKLVGTEGIGKQVSHELAMSGMWAIILSLLGMMIYLWARFEFGFALGAIVSLFHDALFTLGVYCVCGRQVSLTIVAALLTIIGYSVNDTIVIMDRIRENLKLDQRRSFVEICNLSINQTLARTVLTHVTVTLVTLSLFFFGGGAINDFATCMLIGMVVGIYSTVYIATPVTLAWHRGKRPSLGALKKNL